MFDKVMTASGALMFGAQRAIRRASAGTSLFMRIATVVAVGVLGVQLLNDITPSTALGGTGDMTALVVDLLRMQAQVSMKLMALGRDAFAFVWGV
jgi:hypothetical protein